MNGYSSKLSLYDFIVMLMPGSIIVGVLMVLGTDGNLCLPEKTMFWLFFFIASYLAGIINHIVTAILFGKFRNCLWMIHYSYIKAQNKGYHLLDSVTLEEQYFKEPQFSDRCRTILLFALSLIIGVGGVFLIISWIKMYCKIALLLSIFYVLYLFFLIPIICRLCIKKDSKCRTRGEFLIDIIRRTILLRRKDILMISR